MDVDLGYGCVLNRPVKFWIIVDVVQNLTLHSPEKLFYIEHCTATFFFFFFVESQSDAPSSLAHGALFQKLDVANGEGDINPVSIVSWSQMWCLSISKMIFQV